MASLTQDAKVAALKRSYLFASLSSSQLARIAQLCEDQEAPAGTVLCKEDSRGEQFFVIVGGEAEVTLAGERVATLGSGNFFGEIALLEPVERIATVTAAAPLKVLAFSEPAFKAVLETDPEIERKLLNAVARRVVEDQR